MLRFLILLNLTLGCIASAHGQTPADDQKKLADELRANFKTAGTRIDKRFGLMLSQHAAEDSTTWYAAATPIPFGTGEVLMAYGKVRISGNPPIINNMFRFLFVDSKTNKITNDSSPEYGGPNSLPITKNIHDRFLKVTTAESLDIERYYILELDANGKDKDSWTNIYKISEAELRLYRNYIFACYNYIFKSEDLKKYFAKFSWYKPLHKNVDNMLSVEDKAVIAAIQKFENEFHAYKALAAPGLPEKFNEAGKIIPATQAGFFFPPDKISQDDEYTASTPAIKTGGGYLLGLTRTSKPNTNGLLERSHNYVFWKAGKTGEPVSIPMYPSKAGPISYPEVKILQELFVKVKLPTGFDQRDNMNGYEFYVISGNDMFRVSNTPKAELQYFRNYLLARYGSSAPEVKAMFGKYAWYKPVSPNVTYEQFESDDQVLWYGLMRD